MPFKIVILIEEKAENQKMFVTTSGIIVGFVTHNEQFLADFIKEKLSDIDKKINEHSENTVITKLEFDNPKRIN